MICGTCSSTDVLWHGLGGDFPVTKCGGCGDIDCHIKEGRDEGQRCGRALCWGVIEFKPPDWSCTCSTSRWPPCGSCSQEQPLWCPECEWEEGE